VRAAAAPAARVGCGRAVGRHEADMPLMRHRASQLISVFEMTCRMLTIAEGMGQEVKEYRKGSERYESW
jgi:hypothetical protein